MPENPDHVDDANSGVAWGAHEDPVRDDTMDDEELMNH